MKKNWKIALGLGIALTALGGLATWDEWKTKQEDKEKETKGLLTTVKQDQVTAITLHSKGDSDTGGDKTAAAKTDPSKAVDLTVKLVDGKWRITSPLDTLA